MVFDVCKFISLLYGACVLCMLKHCVLGGTMSRWCGAVSQCISEQGNYGNTVACVTGRHGVTLNLTWGLGKLLPIK